MRGFQLRCYRSTTSETVAVCISRFAFLYPLLTLSTLSPLLCVERLVIWLMPSIHMHRPSGLLPAFVSLETTRDNNKTTTTSFDLLHTAHRKLANLHPSFINYHSWSRSLEFPRHTMSAPTALEMSVPKKRKQGQEYSMSADAVRMRERRANKALEVTSSRSPECRDQTASLGEMTAPSETAAKKRNKPGGYSQTRSAIASRERRVKMAPEDRRKMLERQKNYFAAKRREEAKGHQAEEVAEYLGDAEQQNPVSEGETISNEPYVALACKTRPFSNVLIVTLQAHGLRENAPKECPSGFAHPLKPTCTQH